MVKIDASPIASRRKGCNGCWSGSNMSSYIQAVLHIGPISMDSENNVHQKHDLFGFLLVLQHFVKRVLLIHDRKE